MKRIHGTPAPVNVPSDMQHNPPLPCEFKVGDRVDFTNGNGVTFRGKTVRGFAKNVSRGCFIYLDLDCWWFPVTPQQVTPHK